MSNSKLLTVTVPLNKLKDNFFPQRHPYKRFASLELLSKTSLNLNMAPK